MGKKIHKMQSVDLTTRTGICSECGPVRVRLKQSGWLCYVSQSRSSHPPKKHRENVNLSVCVRCGFIPSHPCQMDVHHKDEHHDNNSPENLEAVCSNCHRLQTYQERERRKYAPGNPKRKPPV